MRCRVVVCVCAVAVGVGGCASRQGGAPLSEAPVQGTQTARLAAYAASAKFPAEEPSADEVRVTAVVDRANHTIAIRNFGDEPLKDLDVWVNGSYVRRVPSLPARGGLVINFAQFYDAKGVNLGKENPTVTKVQLRAGSKLYNAMGPAYD